MSPNNGSNPLGEQLIMDDSVNDTSSSMNADTSGEIKMETDENNTSDVQNDQDTDVDTGINQDNVIPEGALFPCCHEYKDPNKKYDHLKSHHNHLREEDNKVCQFCSRKLSSKSSLDRHLLPHAGLKPYKCRECNKLFSTNGNMHRHMKIHKGSLKANNSKNKNADRNEMSKKLKRSLANKQGAAELKCKSQCTEEKDICVGNARKRKDEERRDGKNEEIILRSKRFKQDDSNDEIKINEKQVTTIKIDSNISEKMDTTAAKETSKNGRSEKKGKPRSDLSHTQGSHLLPHFSTPVQGFSDIDSYYINYTDFASAKFPLVAKSICENIDREISFPEHCYQCKVCNKAFPIKAALQLHQKEHKEKNIRSFDDHILNLNQEDEFLCNLGLMRVHENEENFVTSNSGSNSLQVLCTVASKFDQMKFEKDAEGNAISLSPVFQENDLETKNLQKPFEMQSESQTHNKEHICPVCKKEFKNNTALYFHSHKCKLETPFNCILCEKNLTSKSEVLEHIIKVHSIEEKLAEKYIKFNTIKESGTVIKYVCEYCKQEFESSISMENHKRASLGYCPGKPYKCIKCDRTFVSKNNGKRHQANCHKENQAENCIVKNEWVKNKKHVRCSEKANEVSVECNDSNSNFNLVNVATHTTKHSVPKEVLDVAQSLVDMSTQAPPNAQIPAFPSFKNKFYKHGNLRSDMHVDKTSCIKSQREAGGHEEALNLSLRAMDLTTSKKSFSKTQSLNVSTKSMTNDNSTHNTIQNSNYCSLPWLNLTHERKENSSSSTSSFSDTESKRAASVKTKNQPKCNYCPRKFANESNKNRHEKNIHSCRDIPHSVDRSCFTANPRNGSKKNKSVLSKETKEALISKVGYGKITSSTPKTNLIQNLTEPVSIETENLDLASVSSLINTANTPSLKQYLTTDNSEVVSSERPCTSSNDFNSKSLLDTNEEANNSGRNSYKTFCSVCHKEFKNKSALKRHSVTHTKEKLFTCELCNSEFTTKSNRDRHVYNQHTKSNAVLQKTSNKISITELNNKNTIEADLKDMSMKNDLTLSNSTCVTQNLQCNKENERLNVHEFQNTPNNCL